jgi:hypothetical protein
MSNVGMPSYWSDQIDSVGSKFQHQLHTQFATLIRWVPSTADPSEGNTYRFGGDSGRHKERFDLCSGVRKRKSNRFSIFPYRAVTQMKTAAEASVRDGLLHQLRTFVFDIRGNLVFRPKKSQYRRGCLMARAPRTVAQAIRPASCIFDSRIISRGGPVVRGETSALLLAIRAKLSVGTT